MRIYSTNDCYNFTPVSNCWNPLTPTNGQILATGLTPGQVYYFMIDGANGDICDYVIAAYSGVSSAPTITQNQTICQGSSVSLTATNGNTYQWSSTPYDASLTGQTANATINVHPMVTTTYFVTVTKPGDNSFCSNTTNILSSTVNVNYNPITSTSSTDEHCNHHDGTAIVNVASDPSRYNYLWNTNPVNQTTQEAENLQAGQYYVTIPDSNFCSSVDTVIVAFNPNLEPVISGPLIVCDGNTITLHASNSFPVSYLWSDGSSNQSITVSNGGNYSVTASDGNGCTGDTDVFVTMVSSPVPVISGQSYICTGSSLLLEADLGYQSYIWSSGASDYSAIITSGGNYSVTVTDTNGCSGASGIYIALKYNPILNISSTNEICNKANGTTTVTASGGEIPYTYLWSNGSNSPIDTGLIQGVYSVTVHDIYCSSTANIEVFETPGPDAYFYVSPKIKTYSGEPVSFTFHDDSHGNVISWQWDFGDNTPYGYGEDPKHDYNSIGKYIVKLVVSDINMCFDSTTDEITINDLFTFYIPNAFSPDGDGINEGFAPKGNNVDPDNFEMDIYDSWGKLVYKTNYWDGTSTTPWNGSINNNSTCAETVEGIYVYRIYLKEINGIYRQYVGNIMLLK